MLATFYRGRTTFRELMEMPVADLNVLYKIALDRNEKDEKEGKAGQRQLTEAVEDEMG